MGQDWLELLDSGKAGCRQINHAEALGPVSLLSTGAMSREKRTAMIRQWILPAMANFGPVVLLLAACAGLRVQPEAAPTAMMPEPTPMTRLDDQRVLFVVYDRFTGLEYHVPRSILEDLGATVTVASSSLDAMVGNDGSEVRADLLLADVSAGDFDGVVFVGGRVESGDPVAHRVAQQAAGQGGVVAAICSAQATLIRAGLVEGNQAADPAVSEELNVVDTPTGGVRVHGDGHIITAEGPGDTREFGQAIAAALGGLHSR